MDQQQTKETIQRRLSELGWNSHIGASGYERIFLFTEGREAETNQLCFKLVSLGGLQESRDITDDVVDMALTDLARMDEIVQRSSKSANARSNGGSDTDLVSIEQLAAVLESKVENGELAREIYEPPRPDFTRKAVPAAPLPKILLADPSARTRATLVGVLSNDFSVVEAVDGEQAWQMLIEQPDIELVITDLNMPKVDGYNLITRIRDGATSPHLLGMPIIVLSGPEEANAKLRVLTAGANDFIIRNTDARELRTRVVARHKLSKSASNVSIGQPRSATQRYPASGAMPNAGSASKRPSAPAASASGTPANKVKQPAPVAHLAAERRYVDGKRPTVPPARQPAAATNRINSTTTITLTATVLLLVAIAVIIYIGREDEVPSLVVTTPDTAPAGQTSESSRAETQNQATAPVLPDPPVIATPEPSAEAAPPPPAVARAPTRRDEERQVKPNTESSAGISTRSSRAANDRADNKIGNTDAATNTEKPPRAEILPPANRAPNIARSAPPTAATPPAAVESPPKEQSPAEQAVTQPPPASAPAPAASTPSPPPAAATPARPREELAAVEPPAPPKPPANRVAREELSTLVRRFASVYEAGDLDQFMGLFAENARTNDRNGRRGIREDYESLFRSTDARTMKLGEISWELDGNQAYGWGDFDVTVRRAGESSNFGYTGSLTLVVEKVDGRLRIIRLYHGQRRADS